MLLKMLTGLSGPLFSLAPGDEYDFEDAEAERLKAAEFAVDADPKEPVKGKKGRGDVVSSNGDDAGNG
ncbi:MULTISPECIES: hypothetical protein [unclassified Mesorhizobium]|uniref:hypothetical protein n=1 Tax=unclassified Mesorhizobium TaxID=325217 RepID=UPI000FD8ED9E|nr:MULTISPECIES: hypothetical protein [unclassified Mesorhizobium]TGR58265.1 hypothetical protein EN842_01345 [bacterium M00.F.Ca.ET.199.01.1.1]TGU41627.1 hypothetical protein EN799_03470 [bacterium M00.F.Ca.ET.156.01.1.1]TGV89749.1 hypothetical protein EN792_006215 [Mesorhizobium sp. M00.F.Ca.ET.149.01.1.1]TGR33007.1 hypothetical protein EN840_01345 [Mesorhizobium sp. M8A.F.Ca.ET.197.01.1.1]TGR34653.1 hypothetical protein EN845_01345 [Mesorhizobium sp. M8A.F.Ca.ET.202.01.1.1]